MAIFLLVVLIAMTLGIIGAVAKGLVVLLVVGIVVFVADLAFAWVLLHRRSQKPAR
ncbi:MAG TPA: hypothetical protein VFH58_12915 [Acidimicrobiales bacterium]|nr:hypothetical protein [Acidimicrobiales bacterium]